MKTRNVLIALVVICFNASMQFCEGGTPVCEANVTCPGDITTPATGPAGAVVNYITTCTDPCGVDAFNCTIPPGSLFPTGGSTVICTCTGVQGESSSCSFFVTVISVNTPPSFTLGSDVVVAENAGPQSVVAWVTDILVSTPPGNPLEELQSVHFIVSNNNPALFSAQPAVSSVGTLNFTPAPNACGSAIVTVLAQDDGGTVLGGIDTSPPQQREITVLCNTCPTADPLNVQVDQDSQVQFQLLGSDPDGDPLQYSVTQPPTHGVVVIQVQTGAASYSPIPGYCGPDSFEYRVTDGQCESDPALVSINVRCAVVEVNIDVKPGSDPNSFNCGNKGVLPVAILGSATFDATMVDVSTVTLETPNGPIGAQGRGLRSKSDVNGDGLRDLVVDFGSSAVSRGIGCPLRQNTIVPVEVRGMTLDGTSFFGSDTLRIAR